MEGLNKMPLCIHILQSSGQTLPLGLQYVKIKQSQHTSNTMQNFICTFSHVFSIHQRLIDLSINIAKPCIHFHGKN